MRCNKQKHKHIIDAHGQALSLMRKGKASYVRFYTCDRCGCYHVTQMTHEQYARNRK